MPLQNELTRPINPALFANDLSLHHQYVMRTPSIRTVRDIAPNSEPCLLWFGGPNGTLSPRQDQRWAWPLLLGAGKMGILFKKEALEDLECAAVIFVGTHATWPYAQTRIDLQELWGSSMLIGFLALGELFVTSIITVVEGGVPYLPVHYIDTLAFLKHGKRGIPC